MDRIINFILWYKKLRAVGTYKWHNCIEWAISNSGTHYTNGEYFK